MSVDHMSTPPSSNSGDIGRGVLVGTSLDDVGKAFRDGLFKNLVSLPVHSQNEPMLHSAADGAVGCVQR